MERINDMNECNCSNYVFREGVHLPSCPLHSSKLKQPERKPSKVNNMAKWQCDGCGEAENAADASCTLEVWAGEPECCPLTGEECEWYLVKDE